MRSFKFFSCLCAMIVMATTFNLFAALVDDCEGLSNQNKFGQYWYFFDDHLDGGSSTIPGVLKDATGSYIVAGTAGAGHVGAGIVLPYSLGPTKAGTPATYNFIGMGTMISPNGQTIDLTGATSVSFWLKCDKSISLDFQLVDTVNIKDYAYYYASCALTAGTWTKFTIALSEGLGGLQQYAWTLTPSAALSIKTVSKLQWQVDLTGAALNKTGNITIDDVSIDGYTFVPFDLCLTCVGAAGTAPSPGALLSNMDTKPYNRNARGYFWYCYGDGVGRLSPASEFSLITGGAVVSTTDPSLATITIGPAVGTTPAWVKGYNGTNGADITFTLGKTFSNTGSTDVIKPFVGIGTGLWNEQASSGDYNATADGHTGIYFDYTLSGSDSSMVARFEVQANLFDKPGVVHYIDLPYTGAGVWKGATIPFSKLVLPTWTGVVPVPLDATKLKKLQWAVQNNPGTIGEIGVDNVYFTPGTAISKSAIKFQNNSVKGFSGISTSMINNSLKVTFAREMTNASATLVNTKGSVIVKNLMAANHTALLNVTGFAKGVYMLTVKANTKSGIDFNQTMPVTIY